MLVEMEDSTTGIHNAGSTKLKRGSLQMMPTHPPTEPVTPGGVTGRFLCFDKRFFNILVLGFGFMFTFGAFHTTQQVQAVVLNCIQDEYYVGTATAGYVCLALSYVGMTTSFVLAPAVSALLGQKFCMVAGSVFLSMASFAYIRPLEITLYIGALLQGTGSGLCWTVFGHFLTENSTEKTIGRNTGIHWAIFQCGPIILNLYYFFLTRGITHITTELRYTLFAVIIPSSVLGFLTLSMLQHPWSHELSSTQQVSSDSSKPSEKTKVRIAKKALYQELKMTLSKDMFLLAPLFIHMGVSLTLFISVYGTALGYSQQFGELREALVGLNGVFVAVGQVLGGVVYTFLGPCLAKNGRDLGILLALVVDLVAFYIAFLVLPETSSLEMTGATSYIGPNPYAAMIGAVLLGFGDAGWNNPLFALLGLLFQENPVAAFAIFQAYQSFGNVIAFAYSTVLTVSYQLLILTVLAVVGAFGYFIVEWRIARDEIATRKLDLRQKNVLPVTEL